MVPEGSPAGFAPSRELAPAELLDDYVAEVQRRERGALASTALRTRSARARELLARAVGPGCLDDLLAEARGQVPAGTFPIRSGPSAVTDLARVLALQHLQPSDAHDGLALFELARERFGAHRIPPARQALHAQLALRLGYRQRARVLCAEYTAIPSEARAALTMDLANPFATPDGDGAAWLRMFQRYFPAPMPVIAPTGDGETPFDRVTTAPVATVDGDDLVSVIVTSYCPGAELITSVTSLLRQSWGHLEVLVVDDGSPDSYHPLFTKCQELDQRVRLVRLPANVGTYLARNAALDAARGRFVAFQDSDDWSHPVRLEHQLRPLLEDESLVATVSDGLRATADLTVALPGHRVVNQIAASLLFRKEQVLQRVGYFDRVRTAADTEYRYRMAAVFGDDALRRLDAAAYSLIRVRSGSLSGSDFGGGGWIHPGRDAYRSAYARWHERIRQRTAHAYLASSPTRRPFVAPAHVGPVSRPNNDREVDVLVVGDWRGIGEVPRAAWQEMRALARRGLRVAVVHLESFRFATRRRRRLWRPIQDLVNDGTVAQVLLCDEVHASLVVVRQPSVLQFPPDMPSRIRAQRVAIQASEPPNERDGSDRVYAPTACTDAARRAFGAEPVWWCPGAGVRDVLAGLLPEHYLAPAPPGVIDTERPWPPRRGFRSDRPVIGRSAAHARASWPAAPSELLAAYPDSPQFDVRLLGGAATVRDLLGGRLPPNWLAYDDDEVDPRSFFYQIDFYVHFPSPDRVECELHPIYEALAAGCVTILPPAYSSTFGDAAVYCHEAAVKDMVMSYYRDPAGFLRQSGRAAEWARDTCRADRYVTFITSILAGDGTGRAHHMTTAMSDA